jgi:hypothetical protein
MGDNIVSFLGDYFHTVFWGWYGILVAVFALLDFSERVFGLKVTIPTYYKIIGLVSFFLVAQMFAYKDLKEKYNLQAKISPQIVYKDTPETLEKLDSLRQELKGSKNELDILRDTRKFQLISLTPSFIIGFYYNSSGAGWRMENTGLGPATIKWFAAFIDDQPVHTWTQFGKILGVSKWEMTVPYPNSQAVPYKDQILFWAQPEYTEILKKNSSRVHFELCYCALYGQCWVRKDFLAPPKSSSCEPPPKTIFTAR